MNQSAVRFGMEQKQTITQVYETEDEQTAAFQAINVVTDAFSKRFQKQPDAIARAPGRVNLIGEHVDYEGYSVVPCALSLDVLIAFAAQPAADGVIACSASPSIYPEHLFEADPNIEPQSLSLGWAKYIACGFRGVFEHLHNTSQAPANEAVSGLQLMVLGRVPAGSGLSSSSALVCAAALTTAYVHRVQLSKHALATLCAACEKHAGAESGGMDQAISFFGERMKAMHISFTPLRAEAVTLPASLRIVVANSLAESHKAETADSRYNLRVLECALASKCLLAHHSHAFEHVSTLRGAQHKLALSSEQLESAIDQSLHEEIYAVDEIESLLGIAIETAIGPNASLKQALDTNRENGFKLQQRAKHVASEVNRTRTFISAAATNDVASLAGAMDESHQSLRSLYECSCPELDQLVTALREGGARGARLTGAGWGGCAVAVVDSYLLDHLLLHVKGAYYGVQSGSLRSGMPIESAIFATTPGTGACLMDAPLVASPSPSS